MAKHDAFFVGMPVTITTGPFAGPATIVDPKPIPDGGDDRAGAEHQRKVLVAIEGLSGPDSETFTTYILPRQLSIPGRDTIINNNNSQEAALTTLTEHGVLVTAEPITDAMDPALDRFRPNTNVVKKYISRVLPGGFTDVDFLLALRDMRDSEGYSPNVALVGETQSGKTMLVQVLAVLAAERDGKPKPYPVFTLSGSSGVTSYDIFGQTTAVIINGKEVLVWMEGLAAIAARAGGFLYLDEWNAVPPAQAVSLHPLLDDRRQFINTQKAVPDGHGGFAPEVVTANEEFWALSTINPGYKGTQTMAEATSNRFRWLPWDYDDEVEKQLIPSKTIRIMGAALREARLQRVVTVPVGTSVLQRFNADCAKFGVDTAVWTFMGLFPPNERDRVETIIGDGGMLDLLKEEYPTPQFVPTVAQDPAPKLGSTWNV